MNYQPRREREIRSKLRTMNTDYETVEQATDDLRYLLESIDDLRKMLREAEGDIATKDDYIWELENELIEVA